MARALTADMLTAIATGAVKPVFLYEGEFSSGTVRLFTGYGTISWDGNTWTGDNGLMRINAISEAGDLSAVNFTVSLNGQVQSLLSIALGQVRRGKPGSVWLGLLDAAGALIPDPFRCFKGRADKPDIVPDPSSCVIGVAYESRLIDAARRRERRYTPDDQAIDEPGDRGFDFVAQLQDSRISWGRP
jgi:hypothetical protein